MDLRAIDADNYYSDFDIVLILRKIYPFYGETLYLVCNYCYGNNNPLFYIYSSSNYN